MAAAVKRQSTISNNEKNYERKISVTGAAGRMGKTLTSKLLFNTPDAELAVAIERPDSSH